MSNIDKITRRIQGLLAQAADREGTPEGDTFRDRAFELIAQYGVDEAKLQGDSSGNDMVQRTLDVSGTYTVMQQTLMTGIAQALRCQVIGVGSTRKIGQAHIFGRARNVERALLLYSVLMPQMMAGAKRQRAMRYGEETQVLRRSYMTGFIRTIVDRLREIEGHAVEAAGQGLALRDEAAEAKAAAEEAMGGVRTFHSRNRIDRGAMNEGSAAAAGSDLGQQRFGGRAALPR